MAIDTNEIYKTLYHGALMGIRFFGPMLPEVLYRYFGGIKAEEATFVSNALHCLGKSGILAQTTDIFNQFRRFGCHLTAIPINNACAKYANAAFNDLPCLPGIYTIASSAYDGVTACCKSKMMHHRTNWC